MTRLFVVVVVAMLPAILVLASFQHELQVSRKQQARAIALRQAEQLDASLGTIVEGARQLMTTITHFDRVKRFDPSCAAVLRDLQTDLGSYAFLAVTDPQGGLVCSSTANPPPMAALRMMASAAMAAGQFSTGQYMPSLSGQPAYLSFGLPFTLADGTGKGVVIAGLSVDWLRDFLTALERPADSILSVTDRNGIVLARTPDPDLYVGRPVLPEVLTLLAQPRSGTAIVPNFEGGRRIVGFVPAAVPPVRLYVSAGFMLDALTTDIDAAARRGYVMIALGAVLSVVIALIIGQRFVRAPAAVLLRAARGWGSGDLAVRAALPAGAAREFYILGEAFNDMARTLEQQRAELQSLNGALEARVAERTGALLASNNRLQVEIAEREVGEGRLRQAQKLQAVGQLAGGIAHDFNNLLAAVLGSLELLRSRMASDDSQVVRLLDTANAAVERGARLTSKLLGFSRQQPLLSVPIDVAATIEGMAGLMATTLGPAVWMEMKISPGLWTIAIDPNQFEVSILNLALNARDAMPSGGRLIIAADNLVVPPEHATAELPPGGYVSVTVADTGTGMSAETLARAFEPFFTTHALGKGAGLGLSQVHGLVQQSGGDVRIDSRLGAGTRVTMLLPRTRAEPMQLPTSAPTIGDATRLAPDRTILLVDDDDDVREVTAALLMECGYAVLQAANGPDALAIMGESANRIHFVIADYAMPGMNGRDLLNTMRRTRPDLPVLLITGYADFAALIGDGLPADRIVRKPFRSRELVARIQRLWELELNLAR